MDGRACPSLTFFFEPEWREFTLHRRFPKTSNGRTRMRGKVSQCIKKWSGQITTMDTFTRQVSPGTYMFVLDYCRILSQWCICDGRCTSTQIHGSLKDIMLRRECPHRNSSARTKQRHWYKQMSSSSLSDPAGQKYRHRRSCFHQLFTVSSSTTKSCAKGNIDSDFDVPWSREERMPGEVILWKVKMTYLLLI